MRKLTGRNFCRASIPGNGARNCLMHEIGSVSFLVGYPKWKVRCGTAAISLSKRYQGLSPVGLSDRYDRWQLCQKLLDELTWTCTKQITLLPTSTEELSIPPALSFTK